MQCKDIPTIPILKFINSHNGKWCNWYFNDDRNVRIAMPNGFNLHDKLVLAKMRKLINKGYVDGCDCGCCGDFVLTDKGKEFLENNKEI